MSFIVNYGSQIVFNYGYLTVIPKYLCKDIDKEFIKCSYEYLCENIDTVEFKIDKDHKDYIYGYFEQMKMTCWTKPQIAFIGQCYFIGSSLGILFVSLP